MNAAEDKKSCNKSNKINKTNGGTVACSNKVCTSTENSEVLPQKLNGTSQPNSNCNKHPITNGAYSKGAGPSCTIKTSTQTSNGNPENRKSNGSFKDDNGLLLRNCTDSQRDTQRPSKANDRAGFDYDGYSSSEDEECCIYTYKGDSNQMADLPSSFFRLDLVPSKANGNSRNSSPDMDYLEMDFDPGPSNDRYSSSGSECDEEREEERLAVEALMLEVAVERDLTPEPDVNPPTPLSPLSTPSPVWGPRPPSSQDQPCPPVEIDTTVKIITDSGDSKLAVELAPASSHIPQLAGCSTVVPVWSPPLSPVRKLPKQTVEAFEPVISPYCYCIFNKQTSLSTDENFNEGDSGIMVWREEEAREKLGTQLGGSGCGATAVIINTLLALNVPFTTNAVKLQVATRLRAESAPLVDYLISCSNAGATHVDIIRGLQGASQDLVYARFFHMYPQRHISLVSWLSHWIGKGAVPIVTINLQRGVCAGEPVPDQWHHQMVHGVSARGVHLTNPLEVQTETRLWPQLASPSELRVRRDDVMSRWTPGTPLHPLIHPSLRLWRRLNVLGQVVNMVRESQGGSRTQLTQHITIPASYSSGVTIALLRSNPAYDELRLAPELPVDPIASTFS